MSEVQPPDFALLETMRLEAGKVHHLANHLQRMGQSAQHFGFAFDSALAWATVQQAAQQAPWLEEGQPQRLRLLCHRDGKLRAEVTPLGPNPDPVQVHLAQFPVHSAHPFLRHKTTRREVYQQHTAALLAGEDALLYNERGELTELTTGNLVVQLGGKKLTPPTQCGLLAGIGRGLALERGEVQEAVLHLEDLANAEALWHLNSLRGWQQVTLVR